MFQAKVMKQKDTDSFQKDTDSFTRKMIALQVIKYYFYQLSRKDDKLKGGLEVGGAQWVSDH